jgi:hypothetical protein
VRFLPGVPFMGMWLNPNSRGSRLRIWQPWGCKSLHAHHFTATGFSGKSRPRRLKIAEPSGCKSRVADQPSLVELRLDKPACGSLGIADRFGSNPNSLGSASLPTPTSLRSRSFGLASQCGMSTGRASRTCLLNSGLPKRGVWCESTAFRHSCARSSKRAGGLIPRIALDQCRVPERYRTRVPF